MANFDSYSRKILENINHIVEKSPTQDVISCIKEELNVKVNEQVTIVEEIMKKFLQQFEENLKNGADFLANEILNFKRFNHFHKITVSNLDCDKTTKGVLKMFDDRSKRLINSKIQEFLEFPEIVTKSVTKLINEQLFTTNSSKSTTIDSFSLMFEDLKQMDFSTQFYSCSVENQEVKGSKIVQLINNLESNIIKIPTQHCIAEHPMRFNPQNISISQFEIIFGQPKRLFTAGWDGQIGMTEFKTNNQFVSEICLVFENNPINCARYFSSRGLICASNENSLKLFKTSPLSVYKQLDFNFPELGKIVDILEINQRQNNIFSSRIALVMEKGLALFDLLEFQLIKKVLFAQQGIPLVIQARRVQDNCILLATETGSIQIFNPEDETILSTIQCHKDWIHKLDVLNNEGDIVVLTASYDQIIQCCKYFADSKQFISIWQNNTFGQIVSSVKIIDSTHSLITQNNVIYILKDGILQTSRTISELEEINDSLIEYETSSIYYIGKSDHSNVIKMFN